MVIEKTSLVKLDTFGSLTVYAKLENQNPSGSIKYRTVSKMLRDAEESGTLKEGMHLIEISSGNTGIALALRGKELGHPVTIITIKDATERSKELIRSHGAELVELNGWHVDGQKIIDERMKKEPEKWFWIRQLSNPSSLASNFDLGMEIAEQFGSLYKGLIDFYVGSASTGSTLSGTGRALKKVNPKTVVYRVLPKTEYKYPGVDDEGVSTVPTPLYDDHIVDKKIRVEENAAIEAARELQRTYGHDVGISAGADFAAVKEIARQNSGNCVIIFPDSGNRYNILDIKNTK